MLKLSEQTMAAIHEDRLDALEMQIIEHWQQKLQRSGNMAQQEGRDEIISAIKEMSREDPELLVSDLLMIADLMLVEKASEMRQAAGGQKSNARR